MSAPSLNPWLLILLTGIAPLMLSLFVFYRWYADRADYKRVKTYFIQRQNTVMAYDALGVGFGFADLLEKAARDVEILSLLPVTADSLEKFYQTQLGDITKFTGENRGIQEPLHFYRRIAFLDNKGNRVLELTEGKIFREPQPLSSCQLKNLCDHPLIEAAIKLKPGEHHFGTVLRYYSPKNKPEDENGAGLSIAYRTEKGIFVVEIDYRHIKDHLSYPTFPYESKKNLSEAYEKGNYIFILDSEGNMIAHPHYWKVAGIDKTTGDWVPPMSTDSELGTHPIRISAYQRGLLIDYFKRLLNVSFKQKGVDIFRAHNLKGTSRILTVSPILVSRGQFKESEVFGHVILACNVEYFEEPKEMIIPYY